ncbi:MAG: hypothetical protein ACRD4H_08115 [Candidatus Acidiferrales bacterium]
MIRVIHTLGGCGGTLLCRCLGVLPGAAILTEINPGAVKLFEHFHPLYQDAHWLHLLDNHDHKRFLEMDLTEKDNFRQLIEVFHKRAQAKGKHLILRDFSYIDFVGAPYVSQAAGQLTIYKALPPAIAKKAVAFIRHPMDQYTSLSKHTELLPEMTASVFLDAYSSFLDKIGNMSIYKYEAFVGDPDTQMRAVCKSLYLPFEPSFIERFHNFDSVTGDLTRLGETSISLPKKKTMTKPLIEEFRASAVYRRILSATGYQDRVN